MNGDIDVLFYYMVQDHILAPIMLPYHESARSDYSCFSSAYICHQLVLSLLSIAQSVVLLAKYLNEESNDTFKTGSANHDCKQTIMREFSKHSTEAMMLEMLNG